MIIKILHLKQILLGNMNSYFYVDSNVDSYSRLWRHSIMNDFTKSPHFQFKKSFDFPFFK